MCLDPESQGPEGCHQVTGALGRVSLLPTPTGSFPDGLGTLPPIPPRRRPLPHHRRSGFGIRDRMWPEAVGRTSTAYLGARGRRSVHGRAWNAVGRAEAPAGQSPAAQSGARRPPPTRAGWLWVPASRGSWGGTRGGPLPGGPFRGRLGERRRRVPLAGSRGLSRQPAQSAPPDGRGPALRGRFLFVSIPSSSPFNLLQTPS